MDIIAFKDIPIGSMWMAADGGTYGCIVLGRIEKIEDIVVHPFTSKGWSRSHSTIDWFKLQYRYYLVKK